jgi:hypothetical protein
MQVRCLIYLALSFLRIPEARRASLGSPPRRIFPPTPFGHAREVDEPLQGLSCVFRTSRQWSAVAAD